jgi:hypothetical protein
VECARQIAALKWATSPTCLADSMDSTTIIAAHHDLWQVEKSFRMSKSDLRAQADLPPPA